MSTPERFSAVGHPEVEGEFSSGSADHPRTQAYAPRRRRVKRFEIGFFVRKIVKGWLAYCKQLPSESRSDFLTRALLRARTPETPRTEYEAESKPIVVAAHAGGGVDPPDDGPIGETRLEVGTFTAVSTETDDSGS